MFNRMDGFADCRTDIERINAICDTQYGSVSVPAKGIQPLIFVTQARSMFAAQDGLKRCRN